MVMFLGRNEFGPIDFVVVVGVHLFKGFMVFLITILPGEVSDQFTMVISQDEPGSDGILPVSFEAHICFID